MDEVAKRGWPVFGGTSSRLRGRAIRWGGLSLVIGGVLRSSSALFFFWLFGHAALPPPEGYAWLYDVGFFLLEPFGDLFLAAGLFGLYALAARSDGLLRPLAGLGLLLAGLSALGSAGLNVGVPLWGPPDETSRVVFLLDGAWFWLDWAWPIGVIMVGAGVLRARGFGRWRVLPLALGLASTPATDYLLFFALSGGDVEYGIGGAVPTAISNAYPVLIGCGWILLGVLLPRAWREDPERLAAENLEAARRLYEGAWAEGRLAIVDEVVVPDVVDYHHGGHGSESLKRSVDDLHRTLPQVRPDLRFGIEAQTAEGDTVTTCWTASGTDRGGVLWYPPTGKTATFSGVFTDRFSEGRLVEHRGESDTADLLKQLGLPSDR